MARIAKLTPPVTKQMIRDSVINQCIGVIARNGPIRTREIRNIAVTEGWVLPWTADQRDWTGCCALFHQLLQPMNSHKIRNTSEGWLLEGACDDATKAASQNRRLNAGVSRILKTDKDITDNETSDLIQEDLRAAAEMIRELFEDDQNSEGDCTCVPV